MNRIVLLIAILVVQYGILSFSTDNDMPKQEDRNCEIIMSTPYPWSFDVYIDTLGEEELYYIVEDNELKVRSVNNSKVRSLGIIENEYSAEYFQVGSNYYYFGIGMPEFIDTLYVFNKKFELIKKIDNAQPVSNINNIELMYYKFNTNDPQISNYYTVNIRNEVNQLLINSELFCFANDGHYYQVDNLGSKHLKLYINNGDFKIEKQIEVNINDDIWIVNIFNDVIAIKDDNSKYKIYNFNSQLVFESTVAYVSSVIIKRVNDNIVLYGYVKDGDKYNLIKETYFQKKIEN